MEQCLQSMVKELASTSGEREKKIREASEKALILFGQASLTNILVELKQSWGGFVQPFQLGLSSRSSRVVLSSLQGLQAAAYILLGSDIDSAAKDHLVSVVDSIVDCTCSANEVQRERIKIILALVSANASFVHGEQLERVFEAFLEVQSSAKQAATKTAALAGTQQMIHLLGRQLQEYCKVCSESEDGEASWTGPAVVGDYLLLLKLWTSSLQDFSSAASHSMASFLCEVGALESLLTHTTPELVKWRIDVSSVLRDQLVPAVTSSFTHFVESTPFRLNPTAATSTRIKRRLLTYLSSIAAQMVTLMGPVFFLRPSLMELLHSVVLSPAPEKRGIALQHCLHRVLSSLDSLLALAGPTESGSSTMEAVIFGDAQLDLLNQLLTGVTECVSCGDASTRKAAVACVVAFVASLEELTDGKESISPTVAHGLQAFAKEMPNKNKSPEQLSLSFLLGGDGPLASIAPRGGSPQHSTLPLQTRPAPVEPGPVEATPMEPAATVPSVTEAEDAVVYDDAVPEAAAVVPSDRDGGSDGEQATERKASVNPDTPDPADTSADPVQTNGNGGAEDTAAPATTGTPGNHAYALSDANDDASGGGGHGDVPTAPISRSAGPCVAPANTALFVRMLCASLPTLLRMTDAETLDSKLQQMSSLFCSLSVPGAVVPDSIQSVRLSPPPDSVASGETGRRADAGLSVLTADSVYIACYGALATNLFMHKEGCYSAPRGRRVSELDQNTFSEALSDIGVVLSLSPQWIRSLYELLLENDVLALAGFNDDERLTSSPSVEPSNETEDRDSSPVLIDSLIWSFSFLSRYAKPLAGKLSEKIDSTALNLMLGDGASASGSGGDGSVDNMDVLLDASARAPLLKFCEVRPPLSSLVDENVRIFVCKDLLQAAWRSTLLALQLPLQSSSSRGSSGSQPALVGSSGTRSADKHAAGTGAGAGGGSLVAFHLNMTFQLPGSGGDKAGASDAATILSCLDGLRLVARLSCRLAMQRQCAEVLAILSEAAVDKQQRALAAAGQRKPDGRAQHARADSGSGHHAAEDGLKKRPSVLSALRNVSMKPGGGGGGGGSDRSAAAAAAASTAQSSDGLASSVPTIQLSHALCLEALFQLGLQSAMDAPQCWEPVLRCCSYVSDLESSLFTALPASDVNRSLRASQSSAQAGKADSLADILQRDSNASGGGGGGGNGRATSPSETLGESGMVKAISHLSSLAERLFDHVARLLPLPALITFLEYLCRASQEQLATRAKGSGGGVGGKEPTAGLLLRRYSPLLLTACSKAQRPLLHLLRIWSNVSQHLIEGACYRKRAVATIATDCLHQVMSKCIQDRAELPLFSFHKTLLKPMESVIRLGLCDVDTQDQIVCSLCELVEVSRVNIGSGWSVVFGALRSVRLPAAGAPGGGDKGAGNSQANDTNPVMDIIDAVLKSDNAALISDAALDCVECMLKFLSAGHAQNDALAEKALAGVGLCHGLFTSIHQLSSYPDFRGAAEIQEIGPGSGGGGCGGTFAPDATGLLRVWFLLFRGMCDALPDCPAAVQPHLVDKLFALIAGAWLGVPGRAFAMRVMEELLLPSLHRWLQSGITLGLRWKRAEVQSFKHCCGRLVSHVSDLVLPVLRDERGHGGEREGEREAGDGFRRSAADMMQSVLDLMVDCIIQPEEALATMGNASLRFLLLGNGGQLPRDLWHLASTSLGQALRLTLQPLELVIGQFEPYCRGLGGREDRVKITCKKNMTVSTAFRVLHLAKQAFVLPSELQELQRVSAELDELDSQDNSRAASPEKTVATVSKPSAIESSEASLTIHDEDLHSTIEECAVSSTRSTESFSFFWSVPLPSASLFHRPGTGTGEPSGEVKTSLRKKKVRVPFRSLTVSLVTHQLVLHTLSDVLLGEGSGERFEQPASSKHTGGKAAGAPAVAKLNPVLRQFTARQLDGLLDGVLASSQLACSFNRRPGFRLAVAKVGALEQHTPHLLRQAGTGVRIYFHCLLHMLSCGGDELDDWFRGSPDDNDASNGDDIVGTAGVAADEEEGITSKPSIVRDTSAAVDSQQRSADDTPVAEDGVFDRQAVVTKTPPPPSPTALLTAETALLEIAVAKATSSSPAVLWATRRMALFAERLAAYLRNLFHQHEVDGVEDEARLLSERVGEKAESSSTNMLITDLQSVPVCITSQEWRGLEMDHWLSLLEEVVQCVCREGSDERFARLVPLFYAPLLSLCCVGDARVLEALRRFLACYGRLQGLVPPPPPPPQPSCGRDLARDGGDGDSLDGGV